ncbi:aminotransferase class I/II-fold pyridoxal phosphate-dependent enzyme [Streptomyces sp. NPDC090108]|uniref:aminotransferase class I/II-fold pyridoxal phosphate-dependent enzyme n=1 Tax=Streptomyces sp. NPDC090108 TaxID=3365947 RepID=UPI0037F5F2AC
MRAEPRPGRTPAVTLGDYAEAARAALDPGIWDFICGGAGDERAVTANTAAFEAVRLAPRVLSGAGTPDLSVRLFGRTWAMPAAVAPMAHHTMVHPEGELATVRAAGRLGVPTVVSTFAGRTFEELAAAATGPLWLQLYCFRDRGLTRELVERATAAGFEGLVLTVDVPRLGRRHRDTRNTFRLPGHVRPVNLPASDTYSSADVHARSDLDPALDWSVVDRLRSASPLPLLLKGILTPADAARAVGAGADGIIVSNHGGRQLDAAPATLHALPAVAHAVGGRCPVLLDGGVRAGRDIAAAVAHGADAVLVGRPVLHGLAAAGEEGAADVLGILSEEFADVLLQTGRRTPADLDATLLFDTTPPTTSTPARPPAPAPAVPAPAAPAAPAVPADAGGGVLSKAGLHASVSEPVMDTMNFLNEITMRHPDAVSFAPGRPLEDFFDTGQLFRWLRHYIDHLAGLGRTEEQIRTTLFQYGPTAGEIRDLVARTLADDGISADPADIVVTVGAQEAMFLTLRTLFASPRDVLLVASPCYVGITGAARMLDIALAEIPEESDGLTAAALERAVAQIEARGDRPRACYVVPDYSNPSGTTMPLQARHDLLAAAARHGVLIMEDSPYRTVGSAEPLPPLKALDPARCVVHIGSFAKSAFPGARLGYLVADQEVEDGDGKRTRLADEITKLKSMLTVNTPSLSQAVVGGLLLESDFALRERNAAAASAYDANLAAVLDTLGRLFPERERAAHGVSWNHPAGGFFLAVTVPFAADDAALAVSAEQYGVIWTPMRYFHPGAGGEHVIRLAWSYLTRQQAVEGIERLAAFVTDHSRHVRVS